MPKNKTHKGLLKRIRITKTGKVKVPRAGGRHLKSHKGSALVRKYRAPKYVVAAEAGRIGAMLNVHVRSQEHHLAAKRRSKAEPAAAAGASGGSGSESGAGAESGA